MSDEVTRHKTVIFFDNCGVKVTVQSEKLGEDGKKGVKKWDDHIGSDCPVCKNHLSKDFGESTVP